MKILPILNFDSLDEFLTEFIEDISDEDAYTSATVVCDIDMSLNLLRKLFEIDKKFYPEFIDINTVDYDGYYYLSITSDLTVSCVAVEHNGNPNYYIMTDDKRIRSNRCKQITNNAGLMFL